MSSPSQFGPSQPPKSGGSSALKIVLIILVVLALGCGGLCAGCIYYAKQGATEIGKAIEEGVKLGGAYQTTLDAVTSDSQVIAKLGEPINRTSEPKRQNTGEFKTAGETFQFDVKGPMGTGIVSAVAAAAGKDSPYKVTKITVTLTDGTVVDVQPPAEQVDPFDVKIEGSEPK
jgi:cytochrome oxidase complex assembly protein 1